MKPVLLALFLPLALSSCSSSSPPELVKSLWTYCAPVQTIPRTTALKSLHLNIVALGSSTTAGVGASHPQYNYVSRLRSDLPTVLPGVDVKVTNAGIGGQTLTKIAARWPNEVTKVHPDVVILQTGINDAIQRVDERDFKVLLNQLVAEAHAQGIFLVLMGNQYLGEHGQDRYPKLEVFNTLVKETAVETQTPYINRFDLFAYLMRSHNYSKQDLYADDFLHHSDFGYGVLEKCVLHQIFGVEDSEKLLISQ